MDATYAYGWRIDGVARAVAVRRYLPSNFARYWDNTTTAWRDASSSALLCGAGFAVMAGLMCGVVGWGDNLLAGLSFLTLGLVLGLAGFMRTTKSSLLFVKGNRARTPVKNGMWVVAVLMMVHVVFAVSYCRWVPGEGIDCYTFQRDAARDLLHGAQPYGVSRPNIYGPEDTLKFYSPGMVVHGQLQEGLFYPPMTLIWVVPGYLLGDVRYSYILAILLSAGWLYAVCPGSWALYLTSFLLLNPFTFFVENRCWTEPLLLMSLSATVFAAVKHKRWLPVALGVFLASKQYNFLALPFLGFLVNPQDAVRYGRWAYGRLVSESLLIGLATVLPFAVWNFRGLWHDVVLYHLAAPFRVDALSFAVPFPWMTKVGLVLLISFAVYAIRTGKHGGVRGPGMFAGAYALSLLLFVITGKQAAGNYYFLICHALLLASIGFLVVYGNRSSAIEN